MLYNFLSKVCNFNIEYLHSTLSHLGCFGFAELAFKDRDMYEIGKEIGIDLMQDREQNLGEFDGKKRGVFILDLDGGILNCSQPLIPNTEVKFSFERTQAAFSLFYADTKVAPPTTLDNKVVEIKDCYMELEYVSSPFLRNLSAAIVERPLTYHYDDCQIYMKDLPQGSQTFRVNSLCGGLTPEYIFAGFMPSKCLNPDFLTTSVKFANIDIREACITLNGAPVQGYPITPFYNGSTGQFYSRFLDTIGKWKLPTGAGTLNMDTFKTDCVLISHHFEGEQTNEGWIGFDIKFDKPTSTDHTFGKLYIIFFLSNNYLVVFTIRNNALTIDRFHKVTKAIF